jgi:hypothetical protein
LRKGTSLVMAVSCLVSSGCLSGFQHPLGPVGEAFIEPDLLGRWECVAPDDPSSGTITIIDFDGKQYYIQSEFEKGEVSHSRAHATRVEEVPFLNVRAIGPKPEDEWTILQYALVDADHLSFRYVDPQPFEHVIDDALGVSGSLASHLEDPEVIKDLLSCTRSEDSK